jgi:hypothetical protein
MCVYLYSKPQLYNGMKVVNQNVQIVSFVIGGTRGRLTSTHSRFDEVTTSC